MALAQQWRPRRPRPDLMRSVHHSQRASDDVLSQRTCKRKLYRGKSRGGGSWPSGLFNLRQAAF